MSIRTTQVAGSFYPAQAADAELMIGRFNALLNANEKMADYLGVLRGRAVIVPHAGWIYSGFTANIAHRVLAQSHPCSVVVIGPSHRIGFEGVSIAKTDLYQTPLGELRVDPVLLKDLQARFALAYIPDAHHEHSTEVQMPFIKHYLPDAKVIELVYSATVPSDIEPIIDYALGLKDTAVIISTDLSHYYSLEQAKKLDAICLSAIHDENVALLHEGCEACGKIGVEALVNVAKKRGLEAILLDYRTSADASGDTSRVVGYASALFR